MFQQFKIAFSNNLPNFEVVIFLHVDGRLVQSLCLQAWSSSEILGPYTNAHSILPFKFQELQLVGTFSLISPFELLLDAYHRPGPRRCTRCSRNGDNRTQSVSLSDTTFQGAIKTAFVRGSAPGTRLGTQQESRVASHCVCPFNPRISPGHY